MDRGLLGTVSVGRIGAASHPDIGEIKVHVLGTAGGLVVSEARPEVAVYYRGQPAHEFRHRRVAADGDYLLMDDFARAIDTGGETVLGARASRQICAVVAAALESARAARPVDVAPCVTVAPVPGTDTFHGP
jgi:predicted dehydrogenase